MSSSRASREERRAMLDAVVETMRRERDIWTAAPELLAVCEDVLERCLFDHDAALAVLRGEHELDDDPWALCPECECDTYFRLRVEVESRIGAGLVGVGPMLMFVCEQCQYTQLRPRATVQDGLWWERGERVRARPEALGHPYRGDAVVKDDEEPDEADEADEAEAEADEVEEAPVEWSERKVCPDGACIGIIGETGRCNVCGRAAE